MNARKSLLVIASAACVACRNFGEPAPHLTVSPPALTFTATAGGVGPSPRVVTVDPIGAEPREFIGSAVTNEPWLLVEPARFEPPVVARVEARIDGLAVGTYTGTLTFRTVRPPLETPVPVTLVLTSAISLSGRWVGARDTVTLSLEIIQADTAITGDGTLNPPLTPVAVQGVFREPDVTLRLLAPDSGVVSFTGSVVNEQSIAGVLNGGRFAGYALTIFRQ